MKRGFNNFNAHMFTVTFGFTLIMLVKYIVRCIEEPIQIMTAFTDVLMIAVGAYIVGYWALTILFAIQKSIFGSKNKREK